MVLQLESQAESQTLRQAHGPPHCGWVWSSQLKASEKRPRPLRIRRVFHGVYLSFYASFFIPTGEVTHDLNRLHSSQAAAEPAGQPQPCQIPLPRCHHDYDPNSLPPAKDTKVRTRSLSPCSLAGGFLRLWIVDWGRGDLGEQEKADPPHGRFGCRLPYKLSRGCDIKTGRESGSLVLNAGATWVRGHETHEESKGREGPEAPAQHLNTAK